MRYTILPLQNRVARHPPGEIGETDHLSNRHVGFT
jgi:hypothetical protein